MSEIRKDDHETKLRTFVREVKGKYSELYKQIYEKPRVFHSRDWLINGEGMIISPSITSAPLATQAMEVHILNVEPGTQSQQHGHMNSAIMYVLEGKGYDIHDRERLDWQAGDVMIVENGCVHQHFNPEKKLAKLIVIKSKPLFLFFDLIFQKGIKSGSSLPSSRSSD